MNVTSSLILVWWLVRSKLVWCTKMSRSSGSCNGSNQVQVETGHVNYSSQVDQWTPFLYIFFFFLINRRFVNYDYIISKCEIKQIFEFFGPKLLCRVFSWQEKDKRYKCWGNWYKQSQHKRLNILNFLFQSQQNLNQTKNVKKDKEKPKHNPKTLMVPTKSIVLGCSNLFCTNSEELCNNFKWHSFSFWHLQENKHPSDDTYNGIQSKNSWETNGSKQDGKRVSNDDVTDPEREGTNGNAKATHSGWENLRAQDVWDWTKSHHETTKIDHNAGCWDGCIHHAPKVYYTPNNQDYKGQNQDRNGSQQQSPAI